MVGQITMPIHIIETYSVRVVLIYKPATVYATDIKLKEGSR
jgi:hypothetical protein